MAENTDERQTSFLFFSSAHFLYLGRIATVWEYLMAGSARPKRTRFTFIFALVSALSAAFGALSMRIFSGQFRSYLMEPILCSTSCTVSSQTPRLPVTLNSTRKVVEKSSVHSTKIRGVAVNIVTDGPNKSGNFVGLLLNYASVMSNDWKIQLFASSRSMPRLEGLPGVVRLVESGKLVLTAIPPSHNHLGRRELLLSPWLWRSALSDKVGNERLNNRCNKYFLW